MPGPHVVLVGPPGSGKSTVGQRAGRALALAVRDTDADVEATAGKSVAEIFVDDGEPQFRALEAAAVAEALDEHDGVLSLGGGAVLDPRHAGSSWPLPGRRCVVVFLDVGLAQRGAAGRLHHVATAAAGQPAGRSGPR